jgi:hypothetical protein
VPVSAHSNSGPHEQRAATGEPVAFGRLPGWLNRSVSAIAAELRPIDAGSLEVLLYCPDDLTPSTTAQLEPKRTH